MGGDQKSHRFQTPRVLMTHLWVRSESKGTVRRAQSDDFSQSSGHTRDKKGAGCEWEGLPVAGGERESVRTSEREQRRLC